jgi:hypothetical protein
MIIAIGEPWSHGMFAADARSTQTTTSCHPPRASSSRILHRRGINQAVSLATAHCGKQPKQASEQPGL